MAKVLCVLHSPPSLKVPGTLAIWLLLVIGFNPSNMYTLLHGSPMYSNSSVCPYLGYLIRAFIRLFIFVHFFVAHKYFLTYFINVLFVILFLFWFFSSISCSLRLLISSLSVIKGVFKPPPVDCKKTPLGTKLCRTHGLFWPKPFF